MERASRTTAICMTVPQHVSGGKVVFREEWDTGGMFNAVRGVTEWEGKFHAFVTDGWNGGYRGPAKETEQAARDDIERLYRKMYG